LSHTELGTKIGVTFQQVQKYENGGNRIGAGRLSRIAEALEVPASFFSRMKAPQRPPHGTKTVRLLRFYQRREPSTSSAPTRVSRMATRVTRSSRLPSIWLARMSNVRRKVEKVSFDQRRCRSPTTTLWHIMPGGVAGRG
jgi:transcriptional regulator with XRE-family HTH domain